jgi:uncharacterized protein YuzB (UPF0349 family)
MVVLVVWKVIILYALVNGEVVTGETPEQLVDHIYQFLEENPLLRS